MWPAPALIEDQLGAGDNFLEGARVFVPASLTGFEDFRRVDDGREAEVAENEAVCILG